MQVQITVDERGTVTSARAISGETTLRQKAVEAALTKRFEPKIISGRPVKVDAIITYKFDTSSKPAKGPYEYNARGASAREVSSEGAGPD